MVRIGITAAFLAALMANSAASAQTGRGSSWTDPESGTAEHLVRQDFIVSTGATVPHPGLSQSAGETPLDLNVRAIDDNAVEKSICSNCSEP